MGMGEPLHNYDATMKALRILADEAGHGRPPQARDALDGRRRARARPARTRAAHAEPRDLAARDDRRQPQTRSCPSTNATTSMRSSRPAAVSACARRTPHHVRVRAARRRQRHAGRCPPAGAPAQRPARQGQPAAAQRGGRHSVHAPVRRARRRVRGDSRGARPGGVGPQEPRPRHPRRLRPTARRRHAAGRPARSCPTA